MRMEWGWSAIASIAAVLAAVIGAILSLAADRGGGADPAAA
jgi:hypothetical protein